MPPRMQIRDLLVVLKDFEPMVKDPHFLRNGRRIPNFNLLPREAWGNWLLCVVLKEALGRDMTFQEGDESDGYILARDTGEHFTTEHVASLNVPSPNNNLRNEGRVLDTIKRKISRGPEYARGKRLVVFIENAELWYPNRVARTIHGRHNFDAVYCIGLVSHDERNGYVYSVTQLDHRNSPTWKVTIDFDFSNYRVIRV